MPGWARLTSAHYRDVLRLRADLWRVPFATPRAGFAFF
jgi:hypothetical protein